MTAVTSSLIFPKDEATWEELNPQPLSDSESFSTFRKLSSMPTTGMDHRPFIAWDGEGITQPGNEVQDYVLFGASTGDRILSLTGLASDTCLDLIIRVEEQNPDAIHVGFAFQYDVNMILADLPRPSLWVLYRNGKVNWNGYRLEYRPGKWLQVRKGRTVARVFDVWGFFQSSFVKACERFLGENDPELQRIRDGKLARSSFASDELRSLIIPYWEGELRLLVRLLDSLREDLESAGLPIRSWHGPGAVANTVFRQHKIKESKSITPQEVNRAAQFAYAGGRFELFRAGIHNGPVWQYDINSAYPTAISSLPNLLTRNWRHVTDSDFNAETFGLWRIHWDDGEIPPSPFLSPQPFFCRDRYGNVSYPASVSGWYWTPDVSPLRTLRKGLSVLEGWALDDDGSRPFSFVSEMYETRKRWKAEGNSAEKALKLALNSLYGKMAQRAGWHSEGDPIPVWHQLEWAGYVTAVTRSMIWNAIQLAGNSLIATETDAIFTTKELPLPVSDRLGDWSVQQYDGITYLQSGVYFAHVGDERKPKYRGFDPGSLQYGDVLRYLRTGRNSHTRLEGRTTRFIGFGLGLRTRLPWRGWITEPRRLMFGGGGKRAHVPGLCAACKAGASYADCLHDLAIVTAGGHSQPHSLPWLVSRESELRKLDELSRW